MNKSLIGLLQALGVAVYCFLISGFFWGMEKLTLTPPNFLIASLMLTILVFSVAVVGAIVFGYPAYLALNGKIKDGISIFVYTLLYCLGIIAIIIVILAI